MSFFKVTLSDGSTTIMQAHNKTQLRAALAGVKLTRVVQQSQCRHCRQSVATVEGTFCQPCWEPILAEVREKTADAQMSEQELEDKRRKENHRMERRKDQHDMTVYERGYYAGKDGVQQGDYPDEDTYYANLSAADRAEYDLGFYDGQHGTPREAM